MRSIKLFKPFESWYTVWNTMQVLRSGQLAEGPQVKAFEKKFGERAGLKNVAAADEQAQYRARPPFSVSSALCQTHARDEGESFSCCRRYP